MTSSNNRELKDWFRQWGDSVGGGNFVYPEDRRAKTHAVTIARLCSSNFVWRSLNKIYSPLLRNSQVNLEKKTRNFFIRACISWETSDWGRRDDHTSVRKRKLSRLSKSLLKTAEKIKPHIIGSLIPPGPERRAFLKDRSFHPRTLFSFDDEIGEYDFEDYRGDYGGNDFTIPNETPIFALIYVLGRKLDEHARTPNEKPQQRSSKGANYIVALRHHCKDAFGCVANPLILEVARIVSGQRNLTVDKVRIRKKVPGP